MACNPQDIVGKKFTRWTVISVCVEKDKFGFYNYECVCECGNTKIITRSSLTSGKSQSCGCLNKELTSIRTKELHKNANVSDMIGKVFGKLIVIKRHDQVNSDNKYPYVCKCECGGEIIAAKNNLVSERTRSCGCLHYDSLIERHKEYRDNFNHQSFIGKVFGKLTIIEYGGYIDSSYGHSFSCKCECGNIKNYSLYNLKGENSKSCGCIRLEFYGTTTDEYEKWINQLERKRFTRSDVRIQVIKRDNGKCYLCKCESDWYEVHHIEPWKNTKELRFESDNLITLCWNCHFLAHKNLIGQGVDLELTEMFKQYIQSLNEILQEKSVLKSMKTLIIEEVINE